MSPGRRRFPSPVVPRPRSRPFPPPPRCQPRVPAALLPRSPPSRSRAACRSRRRSGRGDAAGGTLSADSPRRRPRRRVSTDYPRRTRDGAASPSPRNIRVDANVNPARPARGDKVGGAKVERGLVPEARAGLSRISTSESRRLATRLRGRSASRPPRLVAAEYPRYGRGGAATHLQKTFAPQNVRRAAVDDVGGDELDQHARLADRAIRVNDFRGRPALVERDDAAERTLERRRAAELGDDPARAVGAQRRELGRVVAERRVVALV